ncbi:hypothetical protein BUE80_DR001899 [Diplocarpon rosae]|nr:hypothetical protein BUE80_DR001899 [Diplocarpon rosae]
MTGSADTKLATPFKWIPVSNAAVVKKDAFSTHKSEAGCTFRHSIVGDIALVIPLARTVFVGIVN